MPTASRWFRGWAWVVVAPVLALLVVGIARQVVDPMFGTPFLAAIFLVSRFVGFRAAAAATLVSALLLDFFVLPPVLSFELDGQTLGRLLMFSIIAIVTAGLASGSKAE